MLYVGYVVDLLKVSGIETHSDNPELFSVLLQLINGLISLVLSGATTGATTGASCVLSVDLTR